MSVAQFEEWWRFGCLSAGCKFATSSSNGGNLEFDLSAASRATTVWWKSHKFMMDAVDKAPRPPGVRRVACIACVASRACVCVFF